MKLSIEEQRLANISTNQIREILSDRGVGLVEKFITYHNANKDVFDLFVTNAYTMHKRGYKHYSAKAVAEKIRWDKDINLGPSEEEFKINNNYTSCYARLVMAKIPMLKDFFKLRAAPGGS